jgi:predicted GNAT family N-acyltransferase
MAAPPANSWRIEPLGKQHDRAAFTCGKHADLDDYLKSRACQDDRRDAAKVYVALAHDTDVVVGYYTLSSTGIDLAAIPESEAAKFARYPIVGATLIGRLARDLSAKGEGLGEFLLMDALYRSRLLSRQVASAAVVVDAKDQSAVTFYKHFGFAPLLNNERKLFLPMRTVDQLFK